MSKASVLPLRLRLHSGATARAPLRSGRTRSDGSSPDGVTARTPSVARTSLPGSGGHLLRLLAFPMRARAAHRSWPDVGSPGSRPRSFCTCQVLRPRRAVRTLRWCVRDVLPSALETASAPGDWLSRLNGWPMPPLPTLRRRPYGRQRTARGRCGSLLLHRSGLAPPTPCRSPGALRVLPPQPGSPVSAGSNSRQPAVT
jgi:hypothetical protein